VELLVATLENVYLGVEELRVTVQVEPPVQLSQGLIHCGAPLLAELTMKNHNRLHQSFHCLTISKEELLHNFWVVNVESTFDMAPLKLIVKATVNY
jgi:hypothetical protein